MCLLLQSGALQETEQVLRNVLFGPITPMFPASFLREHPDVTLVVTE